MSLTAESHGAASFARAAAISPYDKHFPPTSPFDLIGQQHAFTCDFATRRAIKYTPHGEIARSVLGLMLDLSSHEQQVARLERVPLLVVEQYSSTANNEVNFVLSMRCLLRLAQRNGKGYIKRASSEGSHGMFARGAGDARLSLHKTDNAAAISVDHPSLLPDERAHHRFSAVLAL